MTTITVTETFIPDQPGGATVTGYVTFTLSERIHDAAGNEVEPELIVANLTAGADLGAALRQRRHGRGADGQLLHGQLLPGRRQSAPTGHDRRAPRRRKRDVHPGVALVTRNVTCSLWIGGVGGIRVILFGGHQSARIELDGVNRFEPFSRNVRVMWGRKPLSVQRIVQRAAAAGHPESDRDGFCLRLPLDQHVLATFHD